MERPASNYDLQVDIAKRIFLEYDQELLIRKFRLEADPQYLYLTYLNTPCRISRENGQIDEFLGSTWTEIVPPHDITPTATHDKITVASVDANGRAQAAGNDDITVKTGG